MHRLATIHECEPTTNDQPTNTCTFTTQTFLDLKHTQFTYIQQILTYKEHIISTADSTKVLCPLYNKAEILIQGDRRSIFQSLDKI